MFFGFCINRVMEDCFLVLLRMYVRVDKDETVKMIDTRYYHEFESPLVLRDSELREITFSELQEVWSLFQSNMCSLDIL